MREAQGLEHRSIRGDDASGCDRQREAHLALQREVVDLRDCRLRDGHARMVAEEHQWAYD